GLDSAQLAGAPRFQSIAHEVVAILGGAILVAHGAKWDVRFLLAECARCGLDLRLEHWLDTLSLARRVFAFQTFSLGALCTALGIERGQAHRAESDVYATRELFDRCVAVLAPVSPRDLWEVRVGERRARRAVVDACFKAAARGAPVTVVYRPAR